MDKGIFPGTIGQIQLQGLVLWTAISALIMFYAAVIPLFLITGLWLLPTVSVGRFVSRVNAAGRKECHEKDTQSEQAPPSCHDNILFDLADAECTHTPVERGHSGRIRDIGFEVRSNEVYEPVCFECGCHRRRNSSCADLKPAATPTLTSPDPIEPASLPAGPAARVFATPSPLPPPRALPSPSPPSTPLLSSGSAQQQQPALTQPRPPTEPPPTACFGLLSPDDCHLPGAPQSPSLTSIFAADSASADSTSADSASASTSAPSFQIDSAKIALLLTVASPNAKSPRKDVVSSAPSSRRPSFENPPLRRRAAAPGNNRTTSNDSGGSGGCGGGSSGSSAGANARGSLSASHSVSSEPAISFAASGDLGKPSYMRGTAASRARLNMGGAGLHELSRLGCSAQLSSASSSGSFIGGSATRVSASSSGSFIGGSTTRVSKGLLTGARFRS